jgi:PAS domain S-box-containing protein
VKDSADQLRDFIDSIPTLAWSAASDGTAESFNQRWLDYTGLSAPEAAGWGWRAAIHPDDLSRLLDAFHRARESGQPFEFEARLRRLDPAGSSLPWAPRRCHRSPSSEGLEELDAVAVLGFGERPALVQE